MIADIITAGVCGTAGFLFLRGFFHAGAITRILVDQGGPPPMPFVPERDLRKDEWEEYCRKADAAELDTWHKTGVWWLDPNRWGEVPYSKPVLDKAPAPVVDHLQLCPDCVVPMEPMATYAGVPFVWDCPSCRETYKIGAGGLLLRKGLVAQPRKLPCGCDYETRIHERVSPGDRTATCLHCGNWWRPPSNRANPRLLAQGSAVHEYPSRPMPRPHR